MSFIYLASPYSGTHNEQEFRFQAAEKTVAQLLRKGIMVYSPIVHCHTLAKNHDLPQGFGFWSRYNYALLAKASELRVLKLSGHSTSRGVAGEIAFAESCNIPVTFMEYQP